MTNDKSLDAVARRWHPARRADSTRRLAARRPARDGRGRTDVDDGRGPAQRERRGIRAGASRSRAARSAWRRSRRPPPTRSIPRRAHSAPTTSARNMFYNGLTELDRISARSWRSPNRSKRRTRPVGLQAAQRRAVPRRQAAHAGRRRLFDHAPQGPGDRIEGEDARRPDQGREGHRPERGDDHARRRERRPAGDPRAPRTSSSSRTARRTSRRPSAPARTRSRSSRRACARSACATRTTGSRACRISTRSSSIGIGDESARVNALLSGDVHLINAVSPRSTERIKGTPRLRGASRRSRASTPT